MRTTRITVALLAVALAACGGTATDRSSVGSRLARLASRTVVDTIVEAVQKSATPEIATQARRPLALSASRPKAIMGPSLPASPSTIATDTMSNASRGAVTAAGSDSSDAVPAPLVTATVLHELRTKCEDDAKTGAKPVAVTMEPVHAMAQCAVSQSQSVKRG